MKTRTEQNRNGRQQPRDCAPYRGISNLHLRHLAIHAIDEERAASRRVVGGVVAVAQRYPLGQEVGPGAEVASEDAGHRPGELNG